jgi:VIT1/CCC1 family predicted Fe2+/Mn2+ transporter
MEQVFTADIVINKLTYNVVLLLYKVRFLRFFLTSKLQRGEIEFNADGTAVASAGGHRGITGIECFSTATRCCRGGDDSTSQVTITEGRLVSPRVMSDMIIGLSDGLTVPFSLTAGLSSLGNSKLVITGGLAELVSGVISMGLGGYLAAKSESDYYEHQVAKECTIFIACQCQATQTIQEVLAEYQLSSQTIKAFVADLEKSQEYYVNFILKFGRGLEAPDPGREFTSALTIGLAYFFGGFIPLIPYFFTATVVWGLYISAIVMAITLFLFGCTKTVISLGSDCGPRF